MFKVVPIDHIIKLQIFNFRKNDRWVKIRNKLEPNTDFVLDLKPGTLYDIRVTAHNAAGTTLGEYEVAT